MNANFQTLLITDFILIKIHDEQLLAQSKQTNPLLQIKIIQSDIKPKIFGILFQKYFEMSRSNQGHEYFITVFSPEGRLYQVEYAFKAVKTAGITSLGLRGKDCVVLLAEKKVTDRFIDPNTVTNLHNVSTKVGCITTGLIPDGQNILTRLRMEAAGYKRDLGHFIPVDYLAQRIADYNQINTQKALQRVFGVQTIIAGIDEERGPSIYKIDPAGFYYGYKAVASGVKQQDAMNYMQKLYKKKAGDFSENETIHAAIQTIQSVMGQEYKATDLQIGIATLGNPTFKKLSQSEIEHHLTEVSKLD